MKRGGGRGGGVAFGEELLGVDFLGDEEDCGGGGREARGR